MIGKYRNIIPWLLYPYLLLKSFFDLLKISCLQNRYKRIVQSRRESGRKKRLCFWYLINNKRQLFENLNTCSVKLNYSAILYLYSSSYN